MLMRPNDAGVDGVFLIGGRSKSSQGLKGGVPRPKRAGSPNSPAQLACVEAVQAERALLCTAHNIAKLAKPI